MTHLLNLLRAVDLEDFMLVGGAIALGVGAGWEWGWHVGLMVLGGIMLFVAFTPLGKVIHVDSD